MNIRKFDNTEEFDEELISLEYSTDWYDDVPTRNFQFSLEETAMIFNFGMGRIVDVAEDPYVYKGLFERLQIEGVGLRKLDRVDLVGLLNKVAKKATGEAAIAVRDNKVVACLSSGQAGNDFRHLSSSEIFEKTKTSLYSFCGGEEDHFEGILEDSSFITARFELPVYREIKGDPYKVTIRMNTSDYGKSSVHFLASLQNGGIAMPVYEWSIKHRENNAMNAIDETLSMLEKSIDEGSAALTVMESIPIENPVGAMRRIGKQYRLPKRAVIPVIASYERSGNVPTTAFAVYRMMCEGLRNYETGGSALYAKRYGSLIYSLIGIDWKNYDLPGSFSW